MRRRLIVGTLVCAILCTGNASMCAAVLVNGSPSPGPTRKNLTAIELRVLAQKETQSTNVETVRGGDDSDALAIIGGVFIVFILLAAVASASTSGT